MDVYLLIDVTDDRHLEASESLRGRIYSISMGNSYHSIRTSFTDCSALTKWWSRFFYGWNRISEFWYGWMFADEANISFIQQSVDCELIKLIECNWNVCFIKPFQIKSMNFEIPDNIELDQRDVFSFIFQSGSLVVIKIKTVEL